MGSSGCGCLRFGLRGPHRDRSGIWDISLRPISYDGGSLYPGRRYPGLVVGEKVGASKFVGLQVSHLLGCNINTLFVLDVLFPLI